MRFSVDYIHGPEENPPQSSHGQQRPSLPAIVLALFGKERHYVQADPAAHVDCHRNDCGDLLRVSSLNSQRSLRCKRDLVDQWILDTGRGCDRRNMPFDLETYTTP